MQCIVVIGASSGGIDALRTLLAELPADFPTAICVVVHTAAESPGVLPQILARTSSLVVTHPRDADPLKPGHVYVAPPDRHLLVEPGRVCVTKGPRENRFRPAIDPLFRSAAQVFGPGAIGVVLTGNLDDGTSGLDVIKRLGGMAIVQDPADAPFPSMPQSALDRVAVDHVVRVADLAPLLIELTRTHVEPWPSGPIPPDVEVEVKIAKEHNPVDAGFEGIGQPSPFACPECHGVLLQLKDPSLMRFRCHTGHAYSMDSLVAAVSEGVEASLWNSVRSLEEAGLLLQLLAVHVRDGHDTGNAEQLFERAAQAHRQSDAVRQLVNGHDPLAHERNGSTQGATSRSDAPPALK